MRSTIAVVACTVIVSVTQVAAQPSPPPLRPLRPVTLQGTFLGKKNKTAQDLSGIACMPSPPGSGERLCLVVNDESTSAQFATLQGDHLTPGLVVGLIGGAPGEATLGAPPSVACPAMGDFAEFDGEGVAFAAPYFYVVGSHGCSRKKGEFRLSSFHLARMRVNETGQLVGTHGQVASGPPAAGVVELTYRLSDVLQRVPDIQPYVGKALNEANGLNIEGIAVTGSQLWVGLRAPSIASEAFVVGVPIDDLFAPGHAPSQAVPVVVRLAVGPDIGVRDLTALDDSRLLVLTGPAQEQRAPFSLWLVAPQAPDRPRPLGTLDLNDVDPGAKAEAMTVLDVEADALTVLVLFDGLENGAPRQYRVPLQGSGRP